MTISFPVLDFLVGEGKNGSTLTATIAPTLRLGGEIERCIYCQGQLIDPQIVGEVMFSTSGARYETKIVACPYCDQMSYRRPVVSLKHTPGKLKVTVLDIEFY